MAVPGVPSHLGDLIGRSRRRLGERDFWLVQLGVAAVTVVHALIELNHPAHGLTGLFQAVHHIPVIAYLIPVSYAGLRYGTEGGLMTGLLVAIVSVPNMVIIHRGGYAWLGEALAVVFVVSVGIVLSFVVDRERRAAQAVESQARRLAMLSRVSIALGRSSAPSELVRTVIDELVEGSAVQSARFVWADGEDTDLVYTLASDEEQSPGGEISVDVASESRRYGTLRVVLPDGTSENPADHLELLRGIASELAVALDHARLSQLERERRATYLRGVTEAQEEERRRIARELHDNAQSLVLLSRTLEELVIDTDLPDAAAERVDAVRELALGMLEEMRRASRDLRPPALDDLGLVPALEWVVGRHASLTNLDVALTVEGTPRRLPDETELAAFRIAQEALANATKHAGGSVRMRARFSDSSLFVEVSDGGPGFDPGEVRSGFGLTGMFERARQVDGELKLRSGPAGTVVRFTVETPDP